MPRSSLRDDRCRPDLIVDQNRDALVRDLAAFFHELHQFSVERARGLGAASFRAWRDEPRDPVPSRSNDLATAAELVRHDLGAQMVVQIPGG